MSDPSYLPRFAARLLELALETSPVVVLMGARQTGNTEGLRLFREEYADRFAGGLLLHCGTTTRWASPGILSLPWWRVL